MNRDQAREKFLEKSPYKEDRGELIGCDPRKITSEDLALHFTAKSPLKALRGRCLDCCCFQPSEVRKCVSVDCPSWPFRMGTNPFRKIMKLSEAERQRRRELLREVSVEQANEKPRSRSANRAEAQPKPSRQRKGIWCDEDSP